VSDPLHSRPLLAFNFALLWLAMPAALCAQGADRMVVATNVVCRAEAGRSGTPVASLDLAERLTVRRTTTVGPDTMDTADTADTADMAGWLLVDSPHRYGECWVYAPLTTPYDPGRPEDALAAVARHALEADGARSEDWVRVENLLREPPFGIDVDASSELSLLELQVIDGALSTIDRWVVDRDPLKRAWILSHADVVRANEPGGNGYVERAEYWELHDRFADTEWADELAWQAASQPVGGDCEGFLNCYLQRMLEGVAEYWGRHPAGAHVSDAVAEARDRARIVVERACGGPESEVSIEILDELRESLGPVAEEAKRPFLSDLDAIERRCRSVRPRWVRR